VSVIREEGFGQARVVNAALRAEAYQRLKKRIVPILLFNQTLYENLLISRINEETVWLDAGCGHEVLPSWRFGAEKSLIKRTLFSCGCDDDTRAIREHRSLKNRVACDPAALPFKPGTFTLITCNMVVEHLENPERVFTEFARVLKPGGSVIVHTPYRWSYFAVISSLVPQALKGRVGKWVDGRPAEDYYPVRYRCNTPGRLRRLFRERGLEEVRSSMFASDAVLQFLAESSLGRLFLSLELYLLRLSLRPGWRFLRLSICGSYQKPR
jgi:SAM-dependent methyltransferase